MTERPDGSQATASGWVLVAIGVLAVFVAAGAETFEGMVWGALVANLGIGLGILLLSLGYLVKAIWFLPARDIETADAKNENLGSEGADGFHFCDWCHLGLYSPDVACSRQSEEEILADVESKDSLQAACQHELKKRGLISE
ncbi:hypothetical protein [Erythrobacter longus]|nr:hypothetical protein [Erythrobacter longus]